MKTNLIILAAGNSSRFGDNKLLALFHEQPVIEHVLQTCMKYDCIVVGKENIKEFALRYGMKFILNENPERGISYSIQLGIQASDADRYVFVLGDQPLLHENTIKKIVNEQSDHIICVSHNHEWYSPVSFPKHYKKELLTLIGDRGGKVLCHKYPNDVKAIEVALEEVLDVDDKEALQVLEAKYENR